DRAGGVQRRLTEAMVELAAAGAGDERHHAVEDGAPRLVLIEAEVEEVAEEPSGLRHTQDVRALELTRAGVAVGGGRQPQPGARAEGWRRGGGPNRTRAGVSRAATSRSRTRGGLGGR